MCSLTAYEAVHVSLKCWSVSAYVLVCATPASVPFIYMYLYVCVWLCVCYRLSILGSYLISPWVMWQDEVTVCQKAGHGAVSAEAALCARALGIIKLSLPYQSITNNHSGCFLSGIYPSGHQLQRRTDFFFSGCRSNYFSCLSPSFASLWLLLVKTMA